MGRRSTRKLLSKGVVIRRTRQAWLRQAHAFTHNFGWVPEHLKHPLKTIDRYRSPMSDRGPTTWVAGCFAPHVPIMHGYMESREVFRTRFSDSHLVDGPLDGPTMLVDVSGIPTSVSLYLGLTGISYGIAKATVIPSNQLPQDIHVDVHRCMEPAP